MFSGTCFKIDSHLSPNQQLFFFFFFNLMAQWWKSCMQYKRRGRCEFNPWIWKVPWRRKWQPTPVFLSGISHGQKSLVDYSPCAPKESVMAEHTHTHTHRRIHIWARHYSKYLSVNCQIITSYEDAVILISILVVRKLREVLAWGFLSQGSEQC